MTSRKTLVALVLALPFVISGLGAVPAAAADDPAAAAAAAAAEVAANIEAARVRQERLQGSIERQEALITQLQTDRSLVTSALARTTEQLGSINADQEAVRAEIAAATEALRLVELRHQTLLQEIVELDWTIGLLEFEIAEGEEDLAARRGILGERLAEAYRSQHTSLFEQVLAADSFADVAGDVDSHLRFSQQDAALAAAIERDHDALDQMRRVADATRYHTDRLRLEAEANAARIQEEQARLDAARADLEALERQTTAIQAQQQARFSQLVQDEGAAQELVARRQAAEERTRVELADLIAEAERLAEEERLRREAEERARREAEERARREAEERARRLAEEFEGPVPEGAGDGVLMWPVSGVVTQEFGCTGFSWEPAVGDCAHFHDGIDITNASWTPIRAAAAGVVIYAGWGIGDDPAYIVGVAHGNGLESWYIHLHPRNAPGIAPGAPVEAGQTVGYMGNTGHSTGTHLHWEVVADGRAVDPRLFT
jgi:murein DD-endopeptidase MepM/ murein hydrolase activator NlpD